MNYHLIRQLVSRARSALARTPAEFIEIAIPDLIGLEAVRDNRPIPPRPDEREEVNLPRPRTVNVKRAALWALVDAAEKVPGVVDQVADCLQSEGE